MMEERVVPWFHREEFLKVYEEIYSRERKCRKRALNKVAVWRCRSCDRLPVAIDMTATLIESLLNKTVSEKFSSKSSEHQHKMSLSMALIRFVNHIVEKGQTKQFAQSVHVLAEEFGLPEWLVDIRHNATHGSLPSLTLLEEGVMWSLDWLKVEYWEKQIAPEEHVKEPGENQATNNQQYIERLLVNYSQLQFELCNEQSVPPVLRDLLTEIKSVLQTDKKTVVDILTKKGYLMVTESQLQALGVDEISFNDSNLDLPDKILCFWKPLLNLLHFLKIIPELCLKIAEQIDEKTSLENRIRTGWLYEIITSNQRAGKGPQKRDRQLFNTFYELPVESIVQSCLAHTNQLSSLLISSLTHNESFSTETETCIKLFNIYSSSFSKVISTDTLPTVPYTINDLKKSTEKPISTPRKGFEIYCVDSPWQLCTSVQDWRKCPIGIIPGQNPTTLTFDLPSSKQEQSQSDMSTYPVEDLQMDCQNDFDEVTLSGSTHYIETVSVPVINLL